MFHCQPATPTVSGGEMEEGRREGREGREGEMKQYRFCEAMNPTYSSQAVLFSAATDELLYLKDT